MSGKKLLLRILSLCMCVVFLSSDFSAAAAALFTFETQFDYEQADIAWLTDLVVKEDMTTAQGMAERAELVPAPAYPYTETPDSFREEIRYVSALYLLNPDSARAAYIMLFELMNSGAGVIASDVSDEDVKAYLEAAGVKYPEKTDADTLIIARALYTAMITGAAKGDLFGGGNGLEQVLIAYLMNLSGLEFTELKKWMPENSILSLDEYILALSRMTLWTKGYDVEKNTPREEVYRLTALMAIREKGISVNSDADFEELRTKYMAAMVGRRYGVTVSPEKLDRALEDGSAAFYVLQLIGKKAGLAITDENSDYEEAFRLVAEKTGVFDVEKGEFYADIPNYDVYLKNRRSSIWLYPTAYSTNLNGYNTEITVNGKEIRNNYFSKVMLDSSLDEEVLRVEVFCSGSGRESSAVYLLHIHQGSGEAGNPGKEPGVPDTVNPYPSSDSVVEEILSSLGLDEAVSEILSTGYQSIPPLLVHVMPMIAPTFGNVSGEFSEEILPRDDNLYISVLDNLGTMFDADIEGIPWLQSGEAEAVNGIDRYITFE